MSKNGKKKRGPISDIAKANDALGTIGEAVALLEEVEQGKLKSAEIVEAPKSSELDKVKKQLQARGVENGKLRSQLEAALSGLRFVVALRHRLRETPADWYLGTNAVERAEAALKDVAFAERTGTTLMNDDFEDDDSDEAKAAREGAKRTKALVGKKTKKPQPALEDVGLGALVTAVLSSGDDLPHVIRTFFS